MPRPPSGVEVSRHILSLIFAAALLTVVVVPPAHGTRLLSRRRKVRSTPFSPDGENCVRSLAPPLPTEPASLGFGGAPLGQPGALSWAAGTSTMVCINGNDAGGRGYPDFVRRSIEGRTKGPDSAFLWRSDTVSFAAVKRNGVGKAFFKDAVFETGRGCQPLGFGFFLCAQKETRRQAVT